MLDDKKMTANVKAEAVVQQLQGGLSFHFKEGEAADVQRELIFTSSFMGFPTFN